MFMVPTKTALVTAFQNTFDDNYDTPEYRNLAVGLEYPVRKIEYPKVWVDFDPSKLRKLAVDPIFWTPVVNGQTYPYEGWWFEGNSTFTVVAMSSLERDSIFDEISKVIAFGYMNPEQSVFRQQIDSNPFIALEMDWDQIGITGKGEMAHTPWGTDEVIYEITINMTTIGQFFSNPAVQGYPLLEAVKFTSSITLS